MLILFHLYMSLVPQVFHTVVTVSIGLKNIGALVVLSANPIHYIYYNVGPFEI